jgi:acetate kinase
LARWNSRNQTLTSISHEGSFEQLKAALQTYLETNLPCGIILHRIVHGGDVSEGPHAITPDLLKRIQHWQVVAPLHNTLALHLIELGQDNWPSSKCFALFDSALYSQLPPVSKNYALPQGLSNRWPIKRYGFHGLAHRAQWQLVNQQKSHAKVITLQLGSGCSASAWLGDRVIDTTMGFSPLEGLTMATRCGNIDASIVLHLLEYEQGYTVSELRRLLTEDAGMKGLSGISGDIRELLKSSDERAALAVSHFCYQIQKVIGSYIAILGGVDAITFGGGIGENHAVIRKKIVGPLKNLGIVLDEEQNSQAHGMIALHTATSQTEIWLTPVDEIREMTDQFLKAYPPRRTVK